MDYIKKFLGWLKAIVARLFHHPKPIEIPMKSKVDLSGGRLIRWGHNMPKYQPCPAGHGWKKRIEKTMSGANYWCNICRASFWVRTA